MTGSDDWTSSERKLIEEYLAGAGIAFQSLYGSTPAKARTERIAACQAEQGDVFLISLKAGGVGLNLTAATPPITQIGRLFCPSLVQLVRPESLGPARSRGVARSGKRTSTTTSHSEWPRFTVRDP